MPPEKLLVQSEVRNISSLSNEEGIQMYSLMAAYFDGVNEDTFVKDLMSKRWVILLTDKESGRIMGFSTLTLMDGVVDGEVIKAFYSGDTIIDRACRTLFSLERDWVPFVFSHVVNESDLHWYWFMVCKGFRTYRYLPVYFKKFWPSPDDEIPPFEKKVADELARIRFGDDYSPEKFLVSVPEDYRLKAGVGDVTDGKLKNRHIRFFVERNPGWQRGDELACLVPLKPENLHNKVRRMIVDKYDVGQ